MKIRGLKVTGKKTVVREFDASENGIQPVKTAAEIELNLITGHKNKLKSDDFPIPDPFKILHWWMEEDEGTAFRWRNGLSYPDIFIFSMFYHSELGSKDLTDYKNSKACSYYKLGWLQHLEYRNLSGSKYCIISGEYRKFQSTNNG